VKTKGIDKRQIIGPASEEAVYSHVKNIEGSIEEVDSGTLGTCVVCQESVESDRLEIDYTCFVSLDHLSVEEVRDLEHELELAQQVQKTLLPQEIPEMSGLDVAAYSRPAQLLGGDYFDFTEFNDGKYCITLADVAGHGVSASLHMASIQAMLRSIVPTSHSPAEVVSQIHKLFVHNIHFTTFVTFFIGAFDPSSKLFTYCNAGHNPPIVIRTGNEASESKFRLNPTGAAIGLIEDTEFGEKSMSMQSGDLLLMYTDGLVEATNPRMEMFGMNRLQNVVEGHYPASPGDMIREIRRRLEIFVEGRPLSDDTTILACRFH
jgi:sigma-B regulation protein RsbU (phosphoserine phosphatase)